MATIIIDQTQEKISSQNVVATIEGEIKNEVIAFTAHYDSVKFSSGAYDNGTGTVTIFDLLRYYSVNKPKRTLKFVWCGSEEVGLLGSKAYTELHKSELTNYKFCINVDMTGIVIGYDIAVCTSSESLVHYLNYFANIKGFALKVSQGVYSSDSTPFADNGVPAVSFARISPSGGAQIHSRKDVVDFISQTSLDKTTNFIKIFSSEIINGSVFPIDSKMPENMKKELDKYLGRDQNDK